MKKIEDHNTLVFIVDMRANKAQIRRAVQSLYEIQAQRVNTLIRPDGTKKVRPRAARRDGAHAQLMARRPHRPSACCRLMCASRRTTTRWTWPTRLASSESAGRSGYSTTPEP